MSMLPQRKFIKGLVADCSPIMQPPNSLPRISNLVYTHKGSLVTVDGSKILSTEGGGFNTIAVLDLFLFQQNPSTDAMLSTLIGLVWNRSGVTNSIYLINASNSPYTFLMTVVSSFPTKPGLPTMLQFNDQLIIATGPGQPGSPSPLQWFDPTGPVQTPPIGTSGNLVNNFAVSYPQWNPKTSYPANTYIQVPFLYDGTNYYPCLNWVAGSNFSIIGTFIIDSNNNVERVNAGGVSGAGPPIWPTTPIGAGVSDGSINWHLYAYQYTTGATPPYMVFMIYKAYQGGISGNGPQPPIFTTDGVFPVVNPANSPNVNDGSVVWQYEGSLINSANPPFGAEHIIIYGGALWVFNTATTTTDDFGNPSTTPTNGPTCLRMSDLNDPNSWNPDNIAFLGKDDGTVGQGLAVFTIAETGIIPTQSLIAFKDFTTYQITGLFGASDFSIQQAQTDMGCLAPRSIQFLPGYGIGRLAHLGVAIFDGVRDRLISDDIEPYLFGDPSQPDIIPLDWGNVQTCHAAQCIDPAMYLLAIPIVGGGGIPTRVLCYDLILKAWTVVDLPWPIYGFRQIRPEGNQPYTVCGVTSDGSVRRIFSGDPDWDGTPITWSCRTPEVFSKSYAENIYTRAVYIRGSSPDGSLIYPVFGDWATDQVISSKFPLKVQPLRQNQFELFMQMHSKSKNIHADFTGQGRVVIDSFDWDAEMQPEAPSIFI
jgi:hypothetical protein